MTEVDGITQCGHCGEKLTTVGGNDERPIQRLERECPGCEKQTNVGMCWYPDGSYDLIAITNHRDKMCRGKECLSMPRLVTVDSRTEQVAYSCPVCARAHHQRVAEDVL